MGCPGAVGSYSAGEEPGWFPEMERVTAQVCYWLPTFELCRQAYSACMSDALALNLRFARFAAFASQACHMAFHVHHMHWKLVSHMTCGQASTCPGYSAAALLTGAISILGKATRTEGFLLHSIP